MIRLINIRFQAWHFILLSSLVCSCVPYKSLINYSKTDQFPSEPQLIDNYEPIRIQPNDIVQINVNSRDERTSSLFEGGADGYLVSSMGTIDLPLMGKIKLEGLSVDQCKALLQSKLDTFFVQQPIVNVYLANFTISVHGEVGGPGNIRVEDERISLLDAIILAGDFTTYSSRDDILIIREEAGKRTFNTVDFNSIEIMNSPYYYLKQNDVIYVKPMKRKGATVRGASDRLLPYAQFTLSLTLFLTAILNLR